MTNKINIRVEFLVHGKVVSSHWALHDWVSSVSTTRTVPFVLRESPVNGPWRESSLQARAQLGFPQRRSWARTDVARKSLSCASSLMTYQQRSSSSITESETGRRGLQVMCTLRLTALDHRYCVSATELPPTYARRLDLQCNIIYVTYMARGSSGRIVIVVEQGLKEKLYVELARQRLTLKEWFIGQATHFLEMSHHPSLFAPEDFSSRRTQASSGTPRPARGDSK